VAVFPISQRLRYAIPFEEPEETLKIFQKFRSDDADHMLVMAPSRIGRFRAASANKQAEKGDLRQM
jgi:hypothetical protein